ncbi:unnamed protein product [Caenorhabditis sp. 36 PRJEB53466]|nr:unnamed protein product [Caenorhabditis sp. 36 PRJEB53466]
MPEDDELVRKMRVRMDRDAYSVLLSFKDGATPMQLEKRMDETLGYTYNGQYYKGNVHDMAQLLREHPKVRQSSDGKFKIVATEEVADLVALIANQKDGGRKKKPGGGGKGRRPVSSVGYRNGFGGGFGARFSPKGSGMRPITSLAKSNVHKQPHFPMSFASRPLISTSFSRPSTSSSSSNFINAQANTNRQHNSSVISKWAAYSIGQRPLRAPTAPLPSAHCFDGINLQISHSVLKPQQSETVKPETRSCKIPSIKEFSDNAKQMMLMMHPRSVHLSEMTELYSQEFGLAIDPLQLFSKSWNMLTQSTFKDWLEVDTEGNVKLRDASVTRNVAATTGISKLHDLTLSDPAPLPAIQGFRYKVPSPPKSPTELLMQKMKGLTVGARTALPTPEKPPGILKSSSFNPIMKLIGERTNTTVTPASSDAVSVSVQAPILKKKYIEKSEEIKQRISSALNGLPQIQQLRKNGKKTIGGRSATTSRNYNQQNICVLSTENVLASLQNTPTSSENTNSQPSSLSPPQRMRPVQNTAPSLRLIGRALADVKKQDDKTPAPRRTETPLKTELYVTTATTPSEATQQTTASSLVSNVIWNFEDDVVPTKKFESRASYVAGRRPLMLPPMSKGSETQGFNEFPSGDKNKRRMSEPVDSFSTSSQTNLSNTDVLPRDNEHFSREDDHVYTNIKEIEELNSRPIPPTPRSEDRPKRDLLNGWFEYETDVGRTFFYNQETGRSQWIPPRFIRTPAQVQEFLRATRSNLDGTCTFEGASSEEQKENTLQNDPINNRKSQVKEEDEVFDKVCDDVEEAEKEEMPLPILTWKSAKNRKRAIQEL